MLASIIHLILVTISVSLSHSAAQVAKVNRKRENQFVAEVETDCELGKVEHMQEIPCDDKLSRVCKSVYKYSKELGQQLGNPVDL